MKNLRNTLWVLVGLFGLATLVAAPAAADQVILDDLIVDGSICAGFDCVNGESFGFDTLRLKENNLRVKFQDTSSSASFPTFDWTLVANDTSNGGRNRFTIECTEQSRESFTIEGCAPSNSLYVDSAGRVGFGTANPVVDLHVVSGNTPTLRLEQDGSQGFGTQVWDVAGNEANFFIRDAKNGSTLPFRIFPGAASNTLSITANDDVVFNGTTAGNATTTTIQNTTANGAPDIHVASDTTQDAIIGLGDNPDFGGGNSDAFLIGYNGSNTATGPSGSNGSQAFIGTRPGTPTMRFAIENTAVMDVDADGASFAGDCVEFSGATVHCIAAAGSFTCSAGGCP